ncbi:M20/M25/M40 family metallo-hydrolase [Fontivita pretiosa]|uniref:M20/M25/M40 family metallo-hydrolase n=1 Tax=Fontivita pretiosa TaxID=2989684 RepID=UPI003D1845FB
MNDLRVQRATRWTLLALSVALAIWRLHPPGVDSLGFSTAHAMAHLRIIAAEPHPAGSERQALVRQYLIAQLESFGYQVQTQPSRQKVLRRRSGYENEVDLVNVMARRSGSGQTDRAVMLVAHYDSVPGAPGAGDNAAAVAALLEVARILAQQPLRNDLIFLFTDAEEFGLLGARVFVREHPWASDVAVVLNFEGRGSSGPSIMFQTTAGNGWLIDLLARVAPHPVCSSFTFDVYRRLPNDTDFTVFQRHAQMQGMNFAFIDDWANYHRSTDDIQRLDPASMRHHGLQALALGRALATMDLTHLPGTEDAVYFDVLSLAVVRYPMRWALLLAIGLGIVTAVVLAGAVRRSRIRGRGVLVGLGMILINILLAVALSWGIVKLTHNVRLERLADVTIAGYTLLAMLTAAGMRRIFRRTGCAEINAAALIVWTILNFVFVMLAPGGSYLTTWPTLLATLSLASQTLPPARNWPRSSWLFSMLASMLIVLLLSPAIYIAFLGLTLRMAHLMLVPMVLGLWLLPPASRPCDREVVGAADQREV